MDVVVTEINDLAQKFNIHWFKNQNLAALALTTNQNYLDSNQNFGIAFSTHY